MELRPTSQFTIEVSFTLPGNGVNVWKPSQFQAVYKTLPQDQIDKLREEQEEKGNIKGLLDLVLVDVLDVQPVGEKEDGTPYTAVEMVKINQFAANAAVLAYWDAINRDVNAKNSKRSRVG